MPMSPLPTTQPIQPEAPLHVSGLIVVAAPNQEQQLRAQLAQLAGADVHGSSPDGRLIVTLEAESAPQLEDAMRAIQALPSVLHASLAYHYFGDAAAAADPAEAP
jgi:nitrate reductase NapD